MFLARDITRRDIRGLIHRGLVTTNGSYRAMLRLFGVPDEDYKRFLNFLAAHDCAVNARLYRDAMPRGAEPSTFGRPSPLADTCERDAESPSKCDVPAGIDRNHR